jgi:hypothetical protein
MTRTSPSDRFSTAIERIDVGKPLRTQLAELLPADLASLREDEVPPDLQSRVREIRERCGDARDPAAVRARILAMEEAQVAALLSEIVALNQTLRSVRQVPG